MQMGKKGASSCSIKFTGAPASRALPAERRSAGSWWASVGLTTVRSASGVEDLIRHLGHQFHRGGIVDANNMGTGEDCSGDGCSGSVFERRLWRLVQLG